MVNSQLSETFIAHPKGDIHILASNQGYDETCFLVHGFLGHGYWWHWLIPYLSQKYNVIVLDLPGMGQSADRASYSLSDMGDAINHVVTQLGNKQPLHLIGHSFGALSSAHAILQNYKHFKTFHCVDMDLIHLQNEVRPTASMLPRRCFNSESELTNRFRLVPAATSCADEWIKLLAQKSITRFKKGWAWSFDPNVLNVQKNNVLAPFQSLCQSNTMPAQLILGKDTNVLNIEQASKHWASMFNQTNIEVMSGYHHLMLDDPKKLFELIDTFIEGTHGSTK